MKYVVTIPAFNEAKTIGRIIDEIHAVMKQEQVLYEILVLNDGSSDKTTEIAKQHGATVYSNYSNSGLAITFSHEIKRCLEHNADVIIHTDADGQYPATFIPKLIEKIKEGNDLVLGSRFSKKTYSGSKLKYFGNVLFSKLFSKMLNINVTDTTTGFRAFTKKVAMLPIINDFTYTQEQIIRARRDNFKICEIPIKTRTTRPSKLFKNPFEYALKAWINIFRIYRDFAPLRFFGSIGFIIFSFGFFLGVYLTKLHFTVGIEGNIGLLVLCIILLSTGLQIILFGFLADMFKK